MSVTYTQDPDATLDYKFDWASLTNSHGGSNWLAANETIVSACLLADSGITLSGSSIDDASTTVSFWISGGTVGLTYNVVCRISTSNSPARKDDRTMSIRIRGQ
jgi:hypothetical protein